MSVNIRYSINYDRFGPEELAVATGKQYKEKTVSLNGIQTVIVFTKSKLNVTSKITKIENDWENRTHIAYIFSSVPRYRMKLPGTIKIHPAQYLLTRSEMYRTRYAVVFLFRVKCYSGRKVVLQTGVKKKSGHTPLVVKPHTPIQRITRHIIIWVSDSKKKKKPNEFHKGTTSASVLRTCSLL